MIAKLVLWISSARVPPPIAVKPVAGGSASRTANVASKPLAPGGSVAAVLVRGDVNIAATGTVTSVEGNEVLAFGHPFFGAGAISLPMAQAQIINTMVSAQRSFKMAVTGPVVGELTQDRLTALGGVLGAKAPMIPVDGTVQTGRGTTKYSFEVGRDIGMSPRFIAAGLAAALNGRFDVGDRGTVHLRGTIDLEGLPPVQVDTVYAAERDANLLQYAAIDMARNFATLWETPFGPAPRMALHVAATFDPQPLVETLESVQLSSSVVRAGRSVDVAVRLRQNDAATHVEHFTLPIPHAWRGEEISLVATSFDGLERLENEVNGPPRPSELRHVAQWLSERPGNGYLYLAAVREQRGLRAGIATLNSVPPSVLLTVAGDPNTDERRFGLAWQEKRTRPGTVTGMARVSLRVVAP